VFQNSVLRRIFGPKRAEVKKEWRNQYNERLNDLHSSPQIILVIKSRRMRWVGHVPHTGKRRSAHRVLMGKPEGKEPFGKVWCQWENNIKMYLQEVGRKGLDWIVLAQDRDRWWALVNAVMNRRVPYFAGNFLIS
jgi:hypothetical protein